MRILKKKLNCCICNTSNEVDDIYSASGSGAGDLDFRPPFMIRYLVSHQIDVCKKCGYCNTQLDKKLINAEVLIKSSDYKKQLKDLSFSDKASAYCCRAMILESDNQTVDAAWSFLKAAWICDDRKKNRKAVICRKSALEMFGKSREHNRKIFKTSGKEKLLIADIMRRISDFSGSKAICISAMKYRLNNDTRAMLEYEYYLNKNNDDSCQTVEAALDFSKKNKNVT